MTASPPTSDADLSRRFSGVARLYGAHGVERLRAARVAVAGLGGVGSWAVEALARSAIGSLTLIDFDHIAESNTNRQIHALGDAYGRSKVAAMAERVAAINPACRVTTVDEFVTVDNAARLIDRFDAVIDCIDQVRPKAALIARAKSIGTPVVVCGAAGGRVDPIAIRCADLARTSGDALLASVRLRLRKDHGFASHPAQFGVAAVYLPQAVRLPGASVAGAVNGGLSCSGYGSSVTVTATMPRVAAAQAINRLLDDRGSPQ